MRIGIVNSDIPSCLLYRSLGPAEALAAQGEIELVKLPAFLRMRWAMRRHAAREPVGLIEVPDVDVVVFVRGVFAERMHLVVKLLQAEGVAVVVDYDDNYRHLPSQLAHRYKITPSLNPYFNWKHAEDAARFADAVTVSTPALQDIHPGSTLIRNYIPRWYTEIKRQPHERLQVGWSGTIYGHPGGLRVPKAGVTEAIRAVGGQFYNIGDGVDVKKDLGLDEEPGVSGIIPLEEYPLHLAKLDVGIAPLVMSAYANCKSRLKPIEYLSTGAAYVASPSPEYLTLQAELEEWCALNDSPVPGAIAGPKGKEWKRGLLKHLQRPESERQEASDAARRFTRERLLLEDNAWRWGEIWEEAVRRRRKAKVAA